MTINKTVSFDTKVRVCGSLHRKNYSEEEAHSCWYSYIKEDRISTTISSLGASNKKSSSCNRQQRYINSNIVSNKVGPVTLRGFISRSQSRHDGAIIRQRRELMCDEAKFALFEEQQRQFLGKIHDPIRLAYVYSQCTHESKRIARIIGHKGQEWVCYHRIALQQNNKPKKHRLSLPSSPMKKESNI